MDDITEARTQVIHSFNQIGAILAGIDELIKNGDLDLSKEVTDSSIWVELGNFFHTLDDHSLAAEVYSRMLKTINNYGASNIHKGLALYNLGIAQIESGNLEHGIPNVLEALEEDRKNIGAGSIGQPASKLKSEILSFSVSQISRNQYPKFISTIPGKTPAPTLVSLISKLTEDEQLLLSKTILSSESMRIRDDTYTKIILLNNLSNILILCENYQKRRNPAANTLGESLALFKQQHWYGIYQKYCRYTHYKSIRDFENKLQLILQHTFSASQEERFIVKTFLCIVLVRNYIFHNYDPNLAFLRNANLYSQVLETAFHGLFLCLL
jgi:tetratricopeptide (TPR) repeat protein